ncbi:MAG: S41 family peptidase [Pseudomonadota bacterium]
MSSETNKTGKPRPSSRVCIPYLVTIPRAIVIAALAISVFLLPSFATANDLQSREQLRADLTEIYDLLKRYHPNLTTHTTRADMNALYQRITSALPEAASREQTYFLFTELVGAVCDEHTILYMDKETSRRPPDGWPWFTHSLIVSDGRLFMQDPENGTTSEVVRINSLSGREIASGVVERTPTDGCLGNEVVLIGYEGHVNTRIIAHMIGSDGPFEVVLQGSGGNKAREIVVEPVSGFASSVHSERYASDEAGSFSRALRAEGFERQDLDSGGIITGMDYRFSERRNLAFFGLTGFRPFANVSKGIELVMRDIISKDPDALILDLTNNPGGKTRTAMFVMAFLLPKPHRFYSERYVKDVSKERPMTFEFFDEEAEQKRKEDISFFGRIRPVNGRRVTNVRLESFGKPDYKGPIYVLIDPRSGSNAIRMATNLRRLRKARIVGQTTGVNTTTFCGMAYGMFTLEQSGFRVLVPEDCQRSPENRFNEDSSLVPDIEIDVLNHELSEFGPAALHAVLGDLEAQPKRD